MQLAAGKEYQRKTTGRSQMWATDASLARIHRRTPMDGVRTAEGGG